MTCRLISKKDGDFSFIMAETRLKSRPEYSRHRTEQVNLIRKFFQENFQEMPVFIGGDFNDTPESEPIARGMKSEFMDLYSQKQWNLGV